MSSTGGDIGKDIEAGIPNTQSQTKPSKPSFAGIHKSGSLYRMRGVSRSVYTIRSMNTLRSAFSLAGQGSLEPSTYLAAKIGVFLVVASTIAGYVWAGLHDQNTPKLTPPSASALSRLGFDEALAIAPWNFVSPQWVACTIFIGSFILRKCLLPRITDGLYGDLMEAKREKVSNYMLELLGTTLALVLCSRLGFWELLFQPEKYLHVSVDQAYNLALGLNILMCGLVTIYSLELAFDKNMRIGLALHHWTAIGLTLLAIPAIYHLQGDARTIRAFFALSLYMSTEQNVFIELLMYHRKIYWPRMYFASAVYYALTRLTITVLSLWTWWEMHYPVSNINHNSGLVYSLWLVLLPANFLLNFTQIHTVQSLLGLARSVAKRVAMDRSVQQQSSLAIPKSISVTSIKSATSIASSKPCKDLRHTFSIIDFDHTGRVTLEDWREHILGINSEVVLPRSTLDRTFNEMDPSQKGFVTSDEFENFFEPLMVHGVDVDMVLLAVVLKVAVESGAYGPLDGALRYEHSEAVGKIRHQLNETHEGMVGDSNNVSVLDKLCLKDKAPSVEDEILSQAHVLQSTLST